jgi:hypothetical protein
MLSHFRDDMLRNGELMAEGGGADRLHFVAKAKESLDVCSHAADAAKLRYTRSAYCCVVWQNIA